MAAKTSDERLRLFAHLGYRFCGMGHPEEGRQACAKHSNQVPFLGRHLRYVSGGICILAERKPMAAK